MAKFKTGDIVYLKTGSPAMTVSRYKPDQMAAGESQLETPLKVFCNWFEGTTLQEALLREDMLTAEKPK